MSKQHPQFRIWFDRNGVEGFVYVTAPDAVAALDAYKPRFDCDRAVMVEEVI